MIGCRKQRIEEQADWTIILLHSAKRIDFELILSARTGHSQAIKLTAHMMEVAMFIMLTGKPVYFKAAAA